MLADRRLDAYPNTVPLAVWRAEIVHATQPELANKMNVTVTTVARWEAIHDRAWRRRPSASHLAMLHRASKGLVNAMSFDEGFLQAWSAEDTNYGN